MKRCRLFLDALDSKNASINDLNSMDEHLKHCSDCSFDRKVRQELLVSLESLQNVEYPEELHEIAISAINNASKENTKEDNFSKILYGMLRPMEILIPVACIYILICMLQINTESNNEKQYSSTHDYLNSRNLKEDKHNAEYAMEPEKVSSEEVKEFLAKLEEFERTHPESKVLDYRNQNKFKLVVDR